MKARNITIKDVARELSLSVSSVSRALNDKPDISGETKMLVIETARNMGYVHNRLAASLRQKCTGSLGVIIPEIDNQYFSNILAGIEKVVRKHDYDILLVSTNENYRREIEVTKFLIEKRVDGIIAMPARDSRDSIDIIQKNGIPYVCVARRIQSDISGNFVVNDDYKAGTIATEHLLQKGHKRIAFLNGIKGNFSAVSMMAGYKNVLKSYDIMYDPELMLMNNIYSSDGHDSILNLLSSGILFTAVMCFSDMLALGAVKAIKECGMKIPQDIAVIGCDNVQFVDYFEPPLTTIDLAKSELGMKAAEILFKNIANPSMNPQQVVFEPKLVVRQST